MELAIYIACGIMILTSAISTILTIKQIQLKNEIIEMQKARDLMNNMHWDTDEKGGFTLTTTSCDCTPNVSFFTDQ